MGDVARLAHEIDNLLLIARYVVPRVHGEDELTKELSHLEVVILRVIEALSERVPAVTAGMLRSLPGKHEASISRVLTDLENAGYLRREHRPGAGRHLFLSLTDKGHRAAERLRVNDEHHLRTFLRSFKPESIAEALRITRDATTVVGLRLRHQLAADQSEP